MAPRAKSLLFNGIRITVCAFGAYYIYLQLTSGDVTTSLSQMDARLVIAAALIWSPIYLICSWRLKVVMGTQDIHMTFWEAVKLTYAGSFLNFAMPGSTGGDLYKAYCITRLTHKKTEAVAAVFLDRVIGLSSLVVIGGLMSVVGWAVGLDIGWAARVIGGLLLAMIVGAGLFFSHTVRGLIRYDKILERLPFGNQLRRIDGAVFILRAQKRKVAKALGLTILLQLLAIIALIAVAKSLRMNTDSSVPYLVYLPLGFVIRAVPISIQGIGPMDGCFKLFFVDSGLGDQAKVQILALAVRLLDLVWALPGALVLLTGRELPPKDFGQQVEDPVSSSVEQA
ncbi:MAG: flippase-like domain-containing protein [Phycisphaerae bacterium]|nr:flippase-like domain-containing protein [Phycisphaerae bacterium]